MAEEPLQLSVITLMYNTGREVIETIQSVHDEGYSGAVHEVFDDCSTDDSVELVSSFIENRNIPCILHRNTENLGINENKKRALKTVKGVLILGLSDDLIYPGRIQKDVAIYNSLSNRERKRIFAFFGPVEMFDGDSMKTIGLLDPFPEYSDVTIIPNRQMALLLLKSNIVPAISVTMIRSNVDQIEKPDGFFIEDYPLWVNAVLEGFDFLYRPHIATRYRQSEKSVQITRKQEVTRDKFECKKRLLKHKAISFETGMRELWYTLFNNFLDFDRKTWRLNFVELIRTERNLMNFIHGFLLALKRFIQKRIQ